MRTKLNRTDRTRTKYTSDSEYTATQAAKVLGVTSGTLTNWRTQGKGPRFRKLGDTAQSPVVYLKTDVTDYIANR